MGFVAGFTLENMNALRAIAVDMGLSPSVVQPTTWNVQGFNVPDAVAEAYAAQNTPPAPEPPAAQKRKAKAAPEPEPDPVPEPDPATEE